MLRSPSLRLGLLGLFSLVALTACGSMVGSFCTEDDPVCSGRSLSFVQGHILERSDLDRGLDPMTSAELADFVTNVERAMLRGKATSRICSFDASERQRPVHVFTQPPRDSGPLALRQADSLATLEASGDDFAFVDTRGQLVELRDSGELAVEVSYTCGTKHRVSHPRLIVMSTKIMTKYLVVPRGDPDRGDQRLDVYWL
jgi:hypothetical protein